MAMRGQCDPLQVLGQQPLFASLTRTECEALVARSLCRTTVRGELLFREGEPCRGLYLVVQGKVRIYRSNADGVEQVLGVFGPGESLGEVATFDEGPYLSSAIVTAGGRVLFLPLDEVYALYRTHAEVAHAVVHELGMRVRSLTALVHRLALKDVPARVAGEVLHYARLNDAASNGAGFRLPRTQEELAHELGTTREGVARALRGLRQAGVIRQRGPDIHILDAVRLRQLAEHRADHR